jgi:hypothetical protein
LSDVLRDLLGLDISEGALVNILAAGAKPFAAQTSLICKIHGIVSAVSTGS